MISRNNLLTIVLVCTNLAVSLGYRIGVGRADCTGPTVEIRLMGYASVTQTGQGLHLRQFSRAFIIENNDKRVVFVSVDAGSMSHYVKINVIARLQENYGGNYTIDNVVISGTHTHSTPGGFLKHLLYDISILGFVPDTFAALVDGIYESIVIAHNSMQDGRIFISETEVLDANINRSPTSYLENPAKERAQYKFDTDKTLTQMRFINSNSELIGAINWFAVHGTSMNNTNHLVSSDNMGYASILLEKEINPGDMRGQGKFVGAFASSNLGDVSPNTMGPKCEFSGNPCDLLTSSCPILEGQCFSSGPGNNMFESTKIIATKIYEGASKLLQENKGREVQGDVNYIHQFVDMPNYRTTTYNPLTHTVEEVHGCLPAMGYSFAAGTTDGPGLFTFEQGKTTDNILWNTVRDYIVSPTEDDISCHSPKPILLNTGRATLPYEWQPKIVPTQLLKIGNVIITAVPGELTTMAGRRLRNQVHNAALQEDGIEYEIILAGLSNLYSSYITTPEEYQVQRYEAASTIYGPQTLTIYTDQYQKLTQALIRGDIIDNGPEPPHFDERLISLNPDVIYDGHPIGRNYGSVKDEPHASYNIGETVLVTFVAGNPRNNLMHGKTFLAIEIEKTDGSWEVVLTDADWETTFRWERVSSILGFSDVHVSWAVGPNTRPGKYRIKHYGNSKNMLGSISAYEGKSRVFVITA